MRICWRVHFVGRIRSHVFLVVLKQHIYTSSSWLWRHVVEQNITSLCLTGVRGFDAIRAEILQSLITFLHDRLDVQELAGITILETFSCATTDAQLRQCHTLLCPDKPLRLFANDYSSAASVFGRSSTVSLTESGNMLSSTNSASDSCRSIRRSQSFLGQSNCVQILQH